MPNKAALIFLHGSGGNGMEIRAYLEAYRMPAFNMLTFRQVLDSMAVDLYTPTAAERRYTAAGGERMSVWFDRTSNFMGEGLKSAEDLKGADASMDAIAVLISQIAADYDHIIFGGFSMGGGLALHAYRRALSPKLRGVFTMGSFLVDGSAVLKGDLIQHFETIPLLMMHGEDDGLIACSWGRSTATKLHLRGIDTDFRSYPHVDHEIGEEEMADLLHWLRDRLRTVSRAEAKDSPAPAPAAGSSAKGSSKYEKDSLSSLTAEMRAAAVEDGAQPKAAACYPYHIAYTGPGSRVVIHFSVPEEVVETLTMRPVLACGSAFEVTADPLNRAGVQVVALSYDPDKTAQEIGQRLLLRVSRDSSTINPCQMS